MLHSGGMAKPEAKASDTPAFDALSTPHKNFLRAYLAHFNATRAYREAKYKGKGAAQSASALLRLPKIAAAMAEMMPKQGVTPERVTSALAEIAFDGDVADLEDFLRTGKTLKELREAGFNTKLIKGLKLRHETGGTKEKPIAYEHVTVDLHDRLAALRELGRVLGIVTQKHELDVTSESLRGLTEQELLARAHASKLEDGGE